MSLEKLIDWALLTGSGVNVWFVLSVGGIVENVGKLMSGLIVVVSEDAKLITFLAFLLSFSVCLFWVFAMAAFTWSTTRASFL